MTLERAWGRQWKILTYVLWWCSRSWPHPLMFLVNCSVRLRGIVIELCWELSGGDAGPRSQLNDGICNRLGELHQVIFLMKRISGVVLWQKDPSCPLPGSTVFLSKCLRFWSLCCKIGLLHPVALTSPFPIIFCWYLDFSSWRFRGRRVKIAFWNSQRCIMPPTLACLGTMGGFGQQCPQPSGHHLFHPGPCQSNKRIQAA